MTRLCDESLELVGGSSLMCDREDDHPGQHRDDTDGVWWYPKARLEVALCGKINPRTGWVCGLPLGHTGEYVASEGRHLTIIDGEKYDWKEAS